MKHYTILLICFLTSLSGYTQTSGNLSDVIENKRKSNGTVSAIKDNSGLQVIVTYENHKVSSIKAYDKKNNPLNVTYETTAVASANGPIKTEPIICKICITTPGGTIIRCWQIKCSDIPIQQAQ
jgi:hypothetical protein